MENNNPLLLKPCPLCGNADFRYATNGSLIKCSICGMTADLTRWNNRPSEDKLKAVIDVFIKAVTYTLDENFTHKARSRRLQQCLDDARQMLGIAKPKK